MNSLPTWPPKVHVTRLGKKNLQLYYVDPITEKRRWRSARTADTRQAERAAAEWEAELASDQPAINTTATWADFRQAFQSDHMAGKSPHTVAAYRTALNAFESQINPARMLAVTTATVTRCVSHLRSTDISATSISTYLRHLKTAFRWAHKQGYLRAVPTFPTIRTSQMRGRPITEEEFDRILAAIPRVASCHTDPDAWSFYLQGLWYSGLRLAESISLSWDETAEFAVLRNQQDDRLYYRIYSTAQKSRRSQLLPLAPEFAELIASVPPAIGTGPVFTLTGPRGPIRTPNTVGRVIAELGASANVVTAAGKTATAHDFRRSFGTRWARRVAPITLQKMMRHRSIETTMKYYVSIDAEDLAKEIYAAAPPTETAK